jgi:cyclin-dependent kinase 12/13
MGCVISREVSSGIVSEAKEEKSLSAQSNRKVDDLSARKVERNVVGAHNGGIKEEKDGGDGGQKSPGERKRSKANPRSGNLSKHPRGEKVVVQWPPWLTNACGKALDGWTPRRVDTFRKIDKVGTFLFFCGKWKMV